MIRLVSGTMSKYAALIGPKTPAVQAAKSGSQVTHCSKADCRVPTVIYARGRAMIRQSNPSALRRIKVLLLYWLLLKSEGAQGRGAMYDWKWRVTELSQLQSRHGVLAVICRAAPVAVPVPPTANRTSAVRPTAPHPILLAHPHGGHPSVTRPVSSLTRQPSPNLLVAWWTTILLVAKPMGVVSWYRTC